VRDPRREKYFSFAVDFTGGKGYSLPSLLTKK
jgi:hypothetical protein